MFDDLPGNPPSLVKRRVTVRQIADKARLSVATVDRVINGRTTVRRGTALRVQSAAQALGYQFTVPVRVRTDEASAEIVKCVFLLQRRASSFYQQLAEELEQSAQRDPLPGVQVTIEHMDDYLEPPKVAETLRSVGEQVDAVAVVATESNPVSDAIEFLAEQQIPVVALLSDLSSPKLAGYAGINNRMAGRSAAWAIARCADRPGNLGVLIGSHNYIGQEEREIGFRSYFREKGLEFKVLEPSVCMDDPEIAYQQTLELLRTTDELTGIYNVGGGASGVLRAIEEIKPSRKVSYVCHELTPVTRAGLSAGTIDLVLAHDLPELARSALKMLADLKKAPSARKQSVVVPFNIYTSENI
ncbi:MAG: LacI family DNA-binding transcriptional regulator [Verrucomicrobia bacterium]|nr:LacI family DNA-binding transcriptional regulator [Verrucomicrobiota bacterium]